ncbi:hypothetical protein [Nocardia noduli]|uniref:hypothetical protein n=1 Tax=Nocardia noduli TaxID=2815722 RepID=UPI001C24F812|nr:hypothetical protein [Nocardia noduli]
MLVDPDDIHTREDLQRMLEELHTAARISYVRLAAHEGVTVASNTIHGWIHGDTFPQWENLSPVLRAWRVSDGELKRWRNAHRRVVAEARLQPGSPLNEVLDPFALGVHEPITASDSGAGTVETALPRYVRRAHDDQLAEAIHEALAGHSRIVVLIGGSSTGKTRALWQALAPLRLRRGWRLWRPSPFRPEELIEQLDRVGPRTVVWLNETQRYFPLADELDRGRIAEKISNVLADPRRAPIVVLGSLWHEHYAALSDDPTSATRTLLEPVTITVPDNFTGAALDVMRAAARQDPRLQIAVEGAENGMITQYLAGGPELIHVYEKQAGTVGRAVIEAAMDLVRMGHPNVLPYLLLRDIAAGYIDDITWDTLDENWFEAAVTELSRRCKGARGPVTPIKDRPLSPHPRHVREGHRRGSKQPEYQLAEYLGQHGGRIRAGSTPPLGFWTAAAAHAAPDSQYALADAASKRGHSRIAAQLWKNAVGRGHVHAAIRLVKALSTQVPGDRRPADWAVTHVLLDAPFGITKLVNTLRYLGAHSQLQVLADRAAAHLSPDDPHGLAQLIAALRVGGAHSQMMVLADRVVRDLPLDHCIGLNSLIHTLWTVGAHTHMRVLADRAAEHLSLDRATEVALLIEALWEVGEETPLQILADRAATGLSLDNAGELFILMQALWRFGTPGQIQVLADRAAADPTINTGRRHSAAQLIEVFRKSLASTPRESRANATRVTFDSSPEISSRSEQLQNPEEHSQIQAPPHGDSAAHIPLDDAAGIALLLGRLREANAYAKIQQTLRRGIATHVSPADPFGAAELVSQLRAVNAHTQADMLTERLSVAGWFSILVLISDDVRTRFRFGRELDEALTPAEPWYWTDLE